MGRPGDYGNSQGYQGQPGSRGYRPAAVPPQFQQGAPRQDGTQGYPAGYGQPETWQQEAYPQPYQPAALQYRAAARPAARRRQGSGYGAWIAVAAVVLASASGGVFYVLHGRGSSAPGGSTAVQAAAQPETEAGVRSAATRFYALYSAGQWAQAWQMLAPASQHAVPESRFVAVHQGCPSPSAGLARAIRSVTMAGSTAVVTEGLAGAASALGSATDTWDYADGRWGVALAQSSLKDYSHGSASADVAAMKAAGLCAS
jgi:hypothetical protein